MKEIKLFLVIIFVIAASVANAQVSSITISGMVKNKVDKSAIPYVNVVVKNEKDSAFVAGTITNDEGRFSVENIKPGNYRLEVSFTGFENKEQPLFVGSLSAFLDIPVIELEEQSTVLEGVVVKAERAGLSNGLDKKTYAVADNISQSGGSILQSMQNLPGVTVQDGKVQLRGMIKLRFSLTVSKPL
ncbi:carboxypeptidase-like regulatory domain-containing protein [Niabella sp. W65]|nr:carboxypeptidase-like regulatory domain-containing protein [Niabella sp. W65]MCH7362834.1 carboxypeptidase-like regulatory domain-containing protein [Niabella sp. W65]